MRVEYHWMLHKKVLTRSGDLQLYGVMRFVGLATMLLTVLGASAYSDGERKRSLAEWVQALGDERPLEREKAAKHLSRLGAQALAPLREALNSKNQALRKHAGLLLAVIQRQLAATRAIRGATQFPVHLTAVPLSEAAKFLAERSGYTVRVEGLDPMWPVTLKRGKDTFLSHLLALCKEARASFSVDPQGVVTLGQGPIPERPRKLAGPYLAEILWVERARRHRYRGPTTVFARAAVRLSWEPGLQVTSFSRQGRMTSNHGAHSVTETIEFKIPAKALKTTIKAVFKVDLAATILTTTALVGRGIPFDGKGGDAKTTLSLVSMSASASSLDLSFNLRGILQSPRDRAVRFLLEGGNSQRRAPTERLMTGKIGHRFCKLSWQFPKSFTPAKLLVTYPEQVISKSLTFEFEQVRLR
jgi:hypothetical protein